jgi:hypothetical protein
MPTQSRGRGGRSSSIRGRRGRRGAPRGNTNRALTTAGRPAAPRDQSPDTGQSSRGRGTVRRRSASPQTRRIRKRQTNGDASPSERRLRVAIKRGQLYIGRTQLNPKILEHLLSCCKQLHYVKIIIWMQKMGLWGNPQFYSMREQSEFVSLTWVHCICHYSSGAGRWPVGCLFSYSH